MNKEKLQKLSKLASSLTILYVEDDKVLQTKTKSVLDELFTHVDCCDDGVAGLELYQEYNYQNNRFYDLVITDIQMPLMNGVELSKKIVAINSKQNIVVVSAHDDSNFLIEFINIGVMKFIKKPFIFDTFVESLLDVLQIHHEKKIDFGHSIYWEPATKRLYKDNVEVNLSSSEQFLITLFTNNPQQVFSKYDLINMFEEENYDTVISEDSIKSIIKRIRKKIPEQMIVNIYGQGYKLELP